MPPAGHLGNDRTGEAVVWWVVAGLGSSSMSEVTEVVENDRHRRSTLPLSCEYSVIARGWGLR
jgi:hypothetical protein